MNNKFTNIIKLDIPKYEKLAQILKIIINECKIKTDSYYILGSYAIRKQREINDLDINMDHHEFEKLKQCVTYGRIEPYNNQIRWFFDLTDQYQKLSDPNAMDFSIEVFQKRPHEGFPDEDYSLQRLKEINGLDTDEYGHQYFSLQTLLRWKKKMNRPKDQSDIQLIEKLLTNQNAGYYHKYIKYKNKYLNLKLSNKNY